MLNANVPNSIYAARKAEKEKRERECETDVPETEEMMMKKNKKEKASKLWKEAILQTRGTFRGTQRAKPPAG